MIALMKTSSTTSEKPSISIPHKKVLTSPDDKEIFVRITNDKKEKKFSNQNWRIFIIPSSSGKLITLKI